MLNWFGFITIIGRESESSFLLYELNESVVPSGNIHTLTEEDFNEFPQLASAVRDKNRNPFRRIEQFSANGMTYYIIRLTMDEMYTFKGHFWSNYDGLYTGPESLYRFFEYKGKYYKYSFPVIH
jgi:hypothetical protein